MYVTQVCYLPNKKPMWQATTKANVNVCIVLMGTLFYCLWFIYIIVIAKVY